MKILTLAYTILIFTFLPVNVIHATPPPDTIMGPINQVIDILKDPAYQKSDDYDLLWQKIRKAIRNSFDFTPFSRQTLGKYWKIFTLQQRRDFTAAFFEFLACVYIPQLIKGYKGQKIYYDDMEVKLHRVAWVRIKIETVPHPIFLTFNIVNRAGSWSVYDVLVDGASLAEKYRKPFSISLSKESPQKLIDWLKKRVSQQKKSGRCPAT